MNKSSIKSEEPLQAEMAKAFSGPIKPVPVRGTYKLGLAVVSLLMVLLPLVYIGLIMLAGWLLYGHATENHSIISTGPSRFSILIYLAPLISGAILILFMIKPLFARAPEPPETVALTPESDPLVFDWVRRICESVGAPVPARIDVDCHVNASASFRKGFLSFFGNDLVLTIGLPLVFGLNLRQLTGVLAHEFGHFSQGAGMRFSYVIRSINAWFARVVYERDQWDVSLAEASKGIDIRIGIFLYLARFFVWLTRRILWVFFTISNFFSAYLMRQMEFDADRYQARLVGGRTFESTFRALPLLAVAHQRAISELQELWNEKRLGDDIPRLVVHYHGILPENDREKILKEMQSHPGGFFDTHPPDRERIRSTQAEKTSGAFQWEIPSEQIFSNIEKVSRDVTESFYREVLGDEFSSKNLIPVKEMIREQAGEEERMKRINRFFQGLPLISRPPFLSGDAGQPPKGPKEVAESLKALHAEMVSNASANHLLSKQFLEMEERADLLDRLHAAALAGIRFNPAEFKLSSADAGLVGEKKRQAREKLDSRKANLEPLEEKVSRRLILALQLSRLEQVSLKLPAETVGPAERDEMIDLLDGLRALHPTFLDIIDRLPILHVLLSNYEGNQENESLISQVNIQSGRVRDRIKQMKTDAAGIPYPFQHAQGGITLDEFLVGTRLPGLDAIGEIMQTASEAAGRYQTLLLRVIGRLVELAETVEGVLGLSPLPEPPEEREPETESPAT